ncbi:LysE family translocator [Derxia gummosa]|uniref:LysE family translocator n=1 Tax=Derxia gummosa DSM 723 TaxID=1121388 RepID=A0A8B6X0N9_9BURK|nr:LysE family translocator [Derxia gummosa]
MSALGVTDLGWFVVAVMMLNLTPGPDTAFIVGRSLAQGPRAGVMSALGISIGCCAHVLLAAFGLTAIVAASATAFTVIKLAGAAYLIWLGLKMLFARESSGSDRAMADAAGPHAAPTAGARSAAASAATPAFGQGRTAGAPAAMPTAVLLRQAALTNLLNPKVVVFFLSFFPQFVAHDAPSNAVAFLSLGVVFVLMSTVHNAAVGWMAGRLVRGLGSKPGLGRWLGRGVGAGFVALGCKLALTPQH